MTYKEEYLYKIQKMFYKKRKKFRKKSIEEQPKIEKLNIKCMKN